MEHRKLPRRADDSHPKIVLPGLTPKVAHALSMVILEAIQGKAEENVDLFGTGLSMATQLQNFSKANSEGAEVIHFPG